MTDPKSQFAIAWVDHDHPATAMIEPPQHDDHIWLTVHGEAWAIRSIKRTCSSIWLFLWRGYAPEIEYKTLVLPASWDFAPYASLAARWLEAGHA